MSDYGKVLYEASMAWARRSVPVSGAVFFEQRWEDQPQDKQEFYRESAQAVIDAFQQNERNGDSR